MKICIINLAWKGGMLHYASQLSNALSSNNEVFFITSSFFNDYYLFDAKIHIRLVPLPPKKLISLDWIRFDILIKLIYDINPDIIHVTNIHPLILSIIFFIKKPIIVTIHDVKVHPGDLDFLHLFSISTYIFAKRSSFIFVHGKYLKALLSEIIQEDKIIVIPHGNYSFFKKLTDNEYKDYELNNNAALFFGRISEYKGLKYLIDAEAIISRCIPNFKLVIAGQGSMPDLVDLIRGKNITLINRYIEDREVAGLFLNSKVIVMPYIEASQSGIIPIAYSFKRPVVVTDVGSISEIVKDGETGFVVPPRDHISLANAIITILNDDKLGKEMGENGYKKINNELSWDNISKETIKIYENAMIRNIN